MIKFYVQASSMGSIAIAIMTFVIAIYLFSLRNKDKSTWMFLLFFFTFGIFSLRNAFHNSILSFDFLPITGILFTFNFIPLFFLVPFSLYYHKELNKTVSRTILIPYILSVFGVIALFVHKVIATDIIYFKFDTDLFFFKGLGSLSGMVSTVYILTSIIVFLVKSVKFSESDDNVFKKLFFPKGRIPKACRNFSLGILSFILIAITGMLTVMDILTYDMSQIMFIFGTLILWFVLSLLYLNNSPQPSSFMIKIVGISLITILIIFSTLGVSVVTWEKGHYDKMRVSELDNVRVFLGMADKEGITLPKLIELNKSIKIPSDIQYIAVRPEKDGPYSKNYSIIYNTSSNLSGERLVKSDDIRIDIKLQKLIPSIRRSKIKDKN
ncbi:hypothetical protein ACFL20_10520, partial [Spirochaetota bacterium]